ATNDPLFWRFSKGARIRFGVSAPTTNCPWPRTAISLQFPPKRRYAPRARRASERIRHARIQDPYQRQHYSRRRLWGRGLDPVRRAAADVSVGHRAVQRLGNAARFGQRARDSTAREPLVRRRLRADAALRSRPPLGLDPRNDGPGRGDALPVHSLRRRLVLAPP